jgi:hypothetical protein
MQPRFCYDRLVITETKMHFSVFLLGLSGGGLCGHRPCGSPGTWPLWLPGRGPCGPACRRRLGVSCSTAPWGSCVSVWAPPRGSPCGPRDVRPVVLRVGGDWRCPHRPLWCGPCGPCVSVGTGGLGLAAPLPVCPRGPQLMSPKVGHGIWRGPKTVRAQWPPSWGHAVMGTWGHAGHAGHGDMGTPRDVTPLAPGAKRPHGIKRTVRSPRQEVTVASRPRRPKDVCVPLFFCNPVSVIYKRAQQKRGCTVMWVPTATPSL